MDPFTPLEYQRELLRAEYRNTTGLPITTQASLLLGANQYFPFYSGFPYFGSSFLGSPFLFGGYGYGGYWGRRW